MSAWKEISEIGKSVFKGATIAVGTKRLATYADRAIPAVAEKGRQVWDRVKNTKATRKKKKAEEEDTLFEDVEDESPHPDEGVSAEVRPAQPVQFNSSMYDADFEEKKGE